MCFSANLCCLPFTATDSQQVLCVFAEVVCIFLPFPDYCFIPMFDCDVQRQWLVLFHPPMSGPCYPLSGPWPLYYLLVDFSFQWSLANSVLWCCETTDTTLLEIIIGIDKRSFQDTNWVIDWSGFNVSTPDVFKRCFHLYYTSSMRDRQQLCKCNMTVVCYCDMMSGVSYFLFLTAIGCHWNCVFIWLLELE